HLSLPSLEQIQVPRSAATPSPSLLQRHSWWWSVHLSRNGTIGHGAGGGHTQHGTGGILNRCHLTLGLLSTCPCHHWTKYSSLGHLQLLRHPFCNVTPGDGLCT
ncbi:hypothetical protein NDU88_005199, partial [Pleurodeles waltl]